MYKVASDKKQRALHQGRPADWVNGIEQLSAEDQFNQTKEELWAVEQQIFKATGAKKKELGVRKLELQGKLSELRKLAGKERLKASSGFEQVFIQIAREQLSPVQFRAISSATHREMKRRQDEDLTSG